MSLDTIAAALLTATKSSRTTVRLEIPERGIHVNDVAGEATAEGVGSLRGKTSIDQWAAETVQFLRREQRPLVQPDLVTARPAPPPELVQVYGARAQMLGPIVRSGQLVGWVSVHYNDGPREWTVDDVAALETAVTRVHAVLDAGE